MIALVSDLVVMHQVLRLACSGDKDLTRALEPAFGKG